MILPTNPLIDVDALMLRVRAEAARLRDGGDLERARRQRWNAPKNRLGEIMERQNAISAALARAEQRNLPRTQVPARFAKLHGLGRRPVQFVLRAINYFYKPQREVAAAQNTALREITALLSAAAQDLHNLNLRVSELAERLEQRESTIDNT